MTAAPLSSTKMTARLVWHHLLSSDPDASLRFYSGLFGWKRSAKDEASSPNIHLSTSSGEGQLGGIAALDPKLGKGSHWLAYVHVDDVEASVARAERLGGKAAIQAVDLSPSSRVASLFDPEGAHIALYQGAVLPPPPSGVKLPDGTFAWEELLARNPKPQASFYAELFGWQRIEADMGPMGIYTLFRNADSEVAGMMPMPKDAQGQPTWLPYIAMNDVDAAVRKAEGLRANTCVKPTDIPGVGRFSVLMDPQGALFALYRKA